MADYLTEKQRKELQEFSEGKGAAVAGGAVETGLSSAFSGAMAGMSVGAKGGTVLGLPGMAGGALLGLVGGGLVGAFKAYGQHSALEDSQKAQMKQANRASAENKRQKIRERGKASAMMQRAYDSSPSEMAGSNMGSGISSFDIYKNKNYGG